MKNFLEKHKNTIEGFTGENTELLKYILNKLNDNQIRYTLVGNIGFINDEEIDGDIDIVVDREYFNNLPCFFYQELSKIGVRIAQILKHEVSAYYFVFAWFDKNGKFSTLCLDICTDYIRNGYRIIPNNEFIDNRKHSKNGLYVTNYSIEFIYYFIKKIGKNQMNDVHINYLRLLWGKEKEAIKKEITSYWNEEISYGIIRNIENDNWNEIIEKSYFYYTNIKSIRILNRVNLIKETHRIIDRIFNPTGLSIAFFGPDGSGKSTLISSIKKQLSPLFRNYSYTHFRPKFFERRKKTIDDIVVNPHGQKNRSFLTSNLKIIYFYIDYLVAFWLKYIPYKITSTLVIFDRYLDDMLVDSKRYRFAGSNKLLKLILLLIPKPDIKLFLDAPASVLQSRKQEVSYEESLYQRDRYIILSKEVKGIVIDSSKEKDIVIHEAIQSILDHLEKRALNRYIFLINKK